jgi:hypothetical protein
MNLHKTNGCLCFYLFTLYRSMPHSHFYGLYFVAHDSKLIQNDELQRAREESIVTFKITHIPCSEISHYMYINV